MSGLLEKETFAGRYYDELRSGNSFIFLITLTVSIPSFDLHVASGLDSTLLDLHSLGF
jgi:hypothetical protein